MANNRNVYRRKDGSWVNKKQGNDRASSVHRTQKGAEDAARDMLKHSKGGELITHGKNGAIRSKDTIAPGNDPNPPKDTEN